MIPVYTTSPKEGHKILVAQIEPSNKTAYFYITPARFFQKAQALGIDQKVFRKKEIQWCSNFIFELWDGNRYTITRDEFEKKSWLYPNKQDPDYKACLPDFEPKWVITLDKLEKISKEVEEMEMLKIAMS